ncbi:hypothetical protein T11_4324 [Trichinella zimbabwensis]|uniref:Uncharacterized protein n=1 Tax=Trichinella zimbabwensis TaxID=268475 RepID=A0A0V1GVI0_9BILA|nr:hypothetical protein T11_4324 [Trichinella zimbabwensis]
MMCPYSTDYATWLDTTMKQQFALHTQNTCRTNFLGGKEGGVRDGASEPLDYANLTLPSFAFEPHW